MAVVLIGMMGSGKSTVGRKLASALKWDWIDLDRVIEQRAGKSISKIFEEQGEEVFRELETLALFEIEPKDALVLSVGGGAPVNEKNFERLKKLGTIVYLRASHRTLLRRVSAKAAKRPLITTDTAEKLAQLLDSREKTYLQADAVIQVDGQTPKEIVQKLRGVLGA